MSERNFTVDVALVAASTKGKRSTVKVRGVLRGLQITASHPSVTDPTYDLGMRVIADRTFTGEALCDDHDDCDPEIGLSLAASRALARCSSWLERRAGGLLRHQEQERRSRATGVVLRDVRVLGCPETLPAVPPRDGYEPPTWAETVQAPCSGPSTAAADCPRHAGTEHDSRRTCPACRDHYGERVVNGRRV